MSSHGIELLQEQKHTPFFDILNQHMLFRIKLTPEPEL